MKSPFMLVATMVVTASLSTLACSGESEDGDGTDSGSGGGESSSGGNDGSGSSGGETSAGGSGGQVDCCLAAPTCGPGETRVDSEEDCPEGASCYSNTVCCSTIWCTQAEDVQCDAAPACVGGAVEVSECPDSAVCTSQTVCGTTILCQEPEAQCEAYPSCPEGMEEVQECPQDVSCTSQSLCGSTILCTESNPPSCGGGPMCPEGTREVGGCPSSGECTTESLCGTTVYCVADEETCDTADSNRNYVTNNQASCTLVDISCELGLQAFEDECGCGCEQDAACPPYLDCMPGASVDPLCGDLDACPLTPRAY